MAIYIIMLFIIVVPALYFILRASGEDLGTPTKCEKFISSSMKKAEKHDYEGALEDINIALSGRPHEEGLYLQRGKIKEHLDDLNGAKSDYTKALMLNDSYDLAFLNRGLVKMKEKDYSGAKEDMEKAIELNAELEEASIILLKDHIKNGEASQESVTEILQASTADAGSAKAV